MFQLLVCYKSLKILDKIQIFTILINIATLIGSGLFTYEKTEATELK